MHDLHVAQIRRLLPNSHNGMQPLISDASVFEISRLVTIKQPSLLGKFGAMFLQVKKFFWLT